MAERRVRYGILGFGHHAVKRLVPGFAGARRSELVGLWRRDAAKAEANAREFGIPRWFASPEELCAAPEIDAVFVASPDALHLHDTLLALHRGKAVLCEKPLAMNTDEAEQMIAAARAARLQFGVAQNFRYNRSLELMREWIANGRIGRPVLAHAQFCYLAQTSPRAWIYDPTLACGGPIGDVGIHCIDALRFVLGDDIRSVATLAVSDVQSRAVESSASIGLEFAQGCVGTVSVTTRAAYRSLLEVVGEEAVIASENGMTVDHPVDLVLRRGGSEIAREQVSNADAYSRMLDAFSAAIEGDGQYAANGEDGLHNQRVLDAAYASWRSGRREPVTSALQPGPIPL